MSNIYKRALREAADGVLQKYGSEWFETGSQLCTVHKSKIELIAAANPATVLALLDELEAKDKRIAELESREVVLPQRYSMLHRVNFDEPYHTEMVYKQHQVLEVLHDAGVNVAAAGKGEAS